MWERRETVEKNKEMVSRGGSASTVDMFSLKAFVYVDSGEYFVLWSGDLPLTWLVS